MRGLLLVALTLIVAACDGPHEDAGEIVDERNGKTGGRSSIIAGPAEKEGEALDRAAAPNATAPDEK